MGAVREAGPGVVVEPCSVLAEASSETSVMAAELISALAVVGRAGEVVGQAEVSALGVQW